MNYKKVSSSNVDSVGYEEEKSILGVIFKNGSEYHYFNVPKNVYEKLLKSSSIGKFLNTLIKEKGYKYIKIK